MVDTSVVIVGRSFAGLSAALILGRGRESVVVIGDGGPRNASCSAAHGLLAMDSVSPTEVISQAEANLLGYDTVSLVNGWVDEILPISGGFAVSAGSQTLTAERIVLATGVHDKLPPIAGLSGLWGNGVYSCPVCSGYEYADNRWGVIADVAEADGVLLALNWASGVTLFAPDPDGRLRASVARLESRDITVETAPVTVVERPPGEPSNLVVHVMGGRKVVVSAVFVLASACPNNDLAQALGCALRANGRVEIDEGLRTSVPGVYAAGDLVRRSDCRMSYAITDGVRVGQTLLYAAVGQRFFSRVSGFAEP